MSGSVVGLLLGPFGKCKWVKTQYIEHTELFISVHTLNIVEHFNMLKAAKDTIYWLKDYALFLSDQKQIDLSDCEVSAEYLNEHLPYKLVYMK